MTLSLKPIAKPGTAYTSVVDQSLSLNNDQQLPILETSKSTKDTTVINNGPQKEKTVVEYTSYSSSSMARRHANLMVLESPTHKSFQKK